MVLARYQAYVDALREFHLNPGEPAVQSTRRALAQAIEEACVDDPGLLSDFKRAFATRPRA